MRKADSWQSDRYVFTPIPFATLHIDTSQETQDCDSADSREQHFCEGFVFRRGVLEEIDSANK